MKQFIEKNKKKTLFSLFIVMFLLVSIKAQAATTVTVDDNNSVTVSQPVVAVQPVVTETVVLNQAPAIVTREAMAGDFEGRVVGIDYSRNQILIREANNNEKQVIVTADVINSYRVGDYVLVHPTTTLPVLTMQENPKDFEGDIIRIEMSKNQMVVLDTNGRERRVQLKQGMISTYKVDDYVRVHLMADLKEAKTIETLSDVRNLEGNIVSVDTARSQIVVRDEQGKDSILIVRQGLINNYSIGQRVRIYVLPNHEEAQLIRVIR